MIAHSKSEERVQLEFMNWCRRRGLQDESFKVAHHIPNGGKRGKREAHVFKLMGVVAGIPDVFIPIPNDTYHGLYIEFKTDGGSVSKTQKEVHRIISGNGYAVHVCWSTEEAIEVTEAYLEKRR